MHERSAGCAPAARKRLAARAVQESLVAKIVGFVFSASEVATVAMPTDVRSVQVTGNVER